MYVLLTVGLFYATVYIEQVFLKINYYALDYLDHKALRRLTLSVKIRGVHSQHVNNF